MPFTKQQFTTSTGGNALGGGSDSASGDSTAKNIEGTIKLASEKNEFDTWENIKLNLDSILDIWSIRRENETVDKKTSKVDKDAQEGSRTYAKGSAGTDQKNKEDNKDSNADNQSSEIKTDVGQKSGGRGFYIIDKPVGLITVTAPRPLLEKVEAYIISLQKEIYQQISIEAKIIEVILKDNSSIGINWDSVLKGFKVSGSVTFGNSGNIFTWDPATGATSNSRIISSVNLGEKNTGVLDFSALLNALKTQGDAKILSNPKISVLNGQPAMISVGRNITYVKKVTSEVTGTGTDRSTTYTADPGSILSGVGLGLTATILGKNEIVMNLVPVTSELEEGSETAIVVAGEGETSVKMGLPKVNIREMSTIVRVKDGDMLVIGGLISNTTKTDGFFAPVVGDIPLIKYLFGHEEKVKEKKELIILLKPRII
jgi:MSHA type pilus biogenesis protein MshL